MSSSGEFRRPFIRELPVPVPCTRAVAVWAPAALVVSVCNSRLTITPCSAGRPAGLNQTNDEELHSLLTDIETWKSNLPADLQFRGSETPRNAGE